MTTNESKCSVGLGPSRKALTSRWLACCVGWMVGLGSLLLLSPSGHAEQYAAATEVDRSCDGLAAQARRLADELGMPADRRDQALARLRDAFLHGKISAFSKDASLNGITRAITSCTLSLW